MIGTVTFIILVWGIVFLVAAIPGAVIGWVASAMLGYRWGIAVSVMVSIGATILALQMGLPAAYLYLPPLLVAALLGVWTSRTLRARKWLPIATVLVLAAAYGGPLLLTYIMNSEQDECFFGPVSNSQYHDYLRRAKELSSQTPGSFSFDQHRASARFNELFEKLIGQQPSVYERVAASHALLRSFGAQYRNSFGSQYPNTSDPYAKVAKTGGFVGFHYYLDVNRLGLLHPFLLFMRHAWIITNLTGPGDFYRGTDPSVAGDIRFVVNYPAFDTRPPIDRAAEQCPPVPDKTLSERFSRIAR